MDAETLFDIPAGHELDELFRKTFRLKECDWSAAGNLVALIDFLDDNKRTGVRYWSLNSPCLKPYASEVNSLRYYDKRDERGNWDRYVKGTQGFGWGIDPVETLMKAAIDWKQRHQAMKREDAKRRQSVKGA